MGRAIIDAAAARPRPAAIIVITDGYTPWPPTRPPTSPLRSSPRAPAPTTTAASPNGPQPSPPSTGEIPTSQRCWASRLRAHAFCGHTQDKVRRRAGGCRADRRLRGTAPGAPPVPHRPPGPRGVAPCPSRSGGRELVAWTPLPPRSVAAALRFGGPAARTLAVVR